MVWPIVDVFNNTRASSSQCGQVRESDEHLSVLARNQDRLSLDTAEGSVVNLTCSPCRCRIRRSRSRTSRSTRRDLISAKRLSLISNPMISAPWSAKDKAVGSRRSPTPSPQFVVPGAYCQPLLRNLRDHFGYLLGCRRGFVV